MGCLSANIKRKGKLSASLERKGRLDGKFIHQGGLDVDIERTGRLSADFTRKGSLTVNIYLVCTVGTKKYLRVTPEQPLWIVMGEDLTYTIHSNADWIVL